MTAPLPAPLALLKVRRTCTYGSPPGAVSTSEAMATRFRLMYLCNTVRSPLVRVGEWTAAECGKYESFEREPGGRAIAHLSVARAAATPSVAERRPKPCTSVGDTRWKYVVCRLAANSLRAAGVSG